MVGNTLSQTRRRVGWGLMVAVVGGFVWAATPGLPILWGPRASAESKAAGLTLFEHEWTAHDPIAKGDGLGPVFNGRSCVACHFQGGVGGGGANQHNVVSFELLPTRDRPTLKGGLIHAFAIENRFHRAARHAPDDVPDHPRKRSGGGQLPGPDARLRPLADRVGQLDGPLRRGLDRPTLGQDDPPAWLPEVNHQGHTRGCRRVRRGDPGAAACPARWPNRQVWLEGPVRLAGGFCRRRLRQRDGPG